MWALRTFSTSLFLVSGFPSSKRKNGPGPAPLVTGINRAETGHNGPSTFPTTTSTPTLNGSVFDALICTLSMLGACNLSIATSLNVRGGAVSSNSESEGTVISPDCRKPKKCNVAAAYHHPRLMVSATPPAVF